MKKIYSLLILALLGIGSAWAYDFSAVAPSGQTLYYTINGSNAEVTCQNSSSPSYSNLSGALEIPSSVTYNGQTYSVTSIGDCAFYNCSRLTSVTIPNSVTSIGDSAFRNCTGLSTLIVDANNATYDSRDNCNAIIETSSNTLIVGCNNSTIPYSVTSIGEYAFCGCSGLTSVTIPNSVTSIGDYAFSYCVGLTSVTIGNSVTSIGDYAFIGCSRLTSVTIPNSVTSIGDYAFSYCNGLTSVTIPNSVTSVGYAAFEYCSRLTSVTIGNSVTSIGNSAFEYCNRLTSVTIPNSVTSIGYRAFYDCSGLTSVNHTGTIADWCNISFGDEYANPLSYAHHLYINNLEVTSLVIPNTVDSINNYAFYDCSGLTSVTIPNSVTSIGDYAFCGCNGLTSVNYTGTIADWCNISFGNWAANPLTYAHHLYINNSEVTSLVIPNTVDSINNYAFDGCSGLTSVTIPNSVTSIGDYAFAACYGLTSVTIPNSVTSIGDCAFMDCSGLTSVTIGNSVTSIGAGAFEDCSGLTSVTIPNSVTSIGNYAFEACDGLTSVTIGNSVTSIGDLAFAYCRGLQEITSLSQTAPALGYEVFDSVSSTIPVNIPCGSLNSYSSSWSYFSNFVEFVPDGIADAEQAAYTIRITAGRIVVEGINKETVRLFDCMGRCLQTFNAAEGCTIEAPAAGVYLLQVGNNPAQKVVVVK